MTVLCCWGASVVSDSVRPHDGSPPGSPIPGILQATTLEWVAISSSSAWKWKVKVKSLSHVWLFATPWTAAYQAPPSMGFSRQEYWSGVPLPSPIYIYIYIDIYIYIHIYMCVYIYIYIERERERERDARGVSIRILRSHDRLGSISHQWSLSSRASLVASHLQCRRPCFGSLGWKDPLEKEKVTHSYILSWEIPWREESGRL